MKKSIALMLALMMVLALGLAGCGNSGSSGGAASTGGTSTATPESTGGTPAADVNTNLVIVSFFAGETIAPFTGNTDDQTILHQMFDTLIKFTATEEMAPCLAESWTESEDGMVITFKLRQDVTFTDGTPLTADDVVYSYEQWIATPSGPYYQSQFIANVEKVDDYTVTATKAKPYIKGLRILAGELYIVPKAVHEADPAAFAENPVGTGAYTFVKREADGSVTMAANDDYFMGAPQVKTVTVRQAMDYSTSALALQSGDVDMVFNVPASMHGQIESASNLAIATEMGYPCYSLTFPGEPFVSNHKLREAVCYAVNPENVLAMAAAGAGELTNDMLSPRIMGELSGIVDLGSRYDPELAKALLAESGYDTSVPLQLYCDPTTAGMFQVVQADLGAIGLTVELQQVDLMACYTMMLNGECPIYGSPVGNSLQSMEDIIAAFSTTGDVNNRYGAKFPEYDALIDELNAAGDAATRAALTEEAYTMWANNHMTAPFYVPLNNVAYNSRITNMTYGAAIYMTYVSELELSA